MYTDTSSKSSFVRKDSAVGCHKLMNFVRILRNMQVFIFIFLGVGFLCVCKNNVLVFVKQSRGNYILGNLFDCR